MTALETIRSGLPNAQNVTQQLVAFTTAAFEALGPKTTDRAARAAQEMLFAASVDVRGTVLVTLYKGAALEFTKAGSAAGSTRPAPYLFTARAVRDGLRLRDLGLRPLSLTP